jgi:hypothetical protein
LGLLVFEDGHAYALLNRHFSVGGAGTVALAGGGSLSAAVSAGSLVLLSLVFLDLIIRAAHLVMNPRGSSPLLLILSGSLFLPTPLLYILAVNKWWDFLLVLLLPILVFVVMEGCSLYSIDQSLKVYLHLGLLLLRPGRSP